MRPGEVFAGRYVLKEVIGAGRCDDVWLAHDTVVGQDVALKPERIEGDRETAVRRLLGEPRAMAKFRDHPHVVTLFDVVTAPQEGDEPETYWFITEYVPGGGLDRRPPMSPEEAARVGAQLADALAALHRAGIVHCDVKPANIGLTRRGTAKLLDFGAAYRVGGTETITANGPFSFTPDYAAPELARGNVPRPASDVFCLGTTLYALVTGAPPRGGGPGSGGRGEVGESEDSARLRYWKAEQGLVEMDAAAVGPLYPVLTAMLRRDPCQRPSAAEVKLLLEAVAGSGPNPPRGRPAGRLRGRWPLLAGALVAAAALALGLVVIPGGGDDGKAGGGSSPSRGGGSASTSAPRALIGDPRTADMCALVDTDALSRFGDARVDWDYGNFDRCDVLVQSDSETRIDVSVHLRRGAQPESGEPEETVGTISITDEQPQSEECGKLLTPEREAGGFVVGVRAQVGDGTVDGGNATLCTVAGTAARSAAAVLDRGPLPRRSSAYPRTSLAWAEACALIDARALSAVPELAAGSPEAGAGNWSCEWQGKDDVDAELAFFRDEPKTAADGTPVTMSGYDAFVVPEGNGKDTCTVFVEYRRYNGRSTETYAEMLRLYVTGDRPEDELCARATALARPAAAALRAR
ncbi:hypothetical protein GCM10027168_40140 [Streptomyces capparidis]